MSNTIERQIELNASRADVWKALSDHNAFSEWFNAKFNEPFAVGKLAHGQIMYPGYEHVTIKMSIETLEPESLVAFRWHPYAVDMDKDYSAEAYTLVEFKLEDFENGTRLFLKESGFDQLPEDRRLQAYQMNSDGWDEQLENIKTYLEK